jgi:BRCA1-associated ATM activator 1
MIDGTFPAVTFSKEHKKIITLNDKEIQLRLRKVLNELSLRGCLGILLSCLKDSDLEVVKKSVQIVEKVMGYLNKYNFVEEYNKTKKGSDAKITPVKPVIDSNYSEFQNKLAAAEDPTVRNNADFSKRTCVKLSSSTKENGEGCPNGDIVIESIVKCNDLSLLSNTYKNNIKICEKVELGQIEENLFKKFATVSPDEFLNFVTTNDLQVLIHNKSEWLQHSENFSSLLDDVLRSFNKDMDLDCY